MWNASQWVYSLDGIAVPQTKLTHREARAMARANPPNTRLEASGAIFMALVTINARLNSWAAEISNVVSDQPCERHFTVEGNIHRHTRFALGAELTGLVVSMRRTYQPLESNLTQTLGLRPNPVFDVPPGQQRPIGAATSAEGILTVLLFPGEAVFDELWSRSVSGAVMPSVLNLNIRGEGEVWQDGIIAWDTTQNPQLPVMSASFKATSTFVWPEP
jgi:hypothetical protein